MTLFLSPTKSPHQYNQVAQDLKRRVAAILFIASRSIAFDILGSPELQVLVHAARGTMDKSKNVYLQLLPDVYNSVAAISAPKTKLFVRRLEHASGCFYLQDDVPFH